MATPKVVLALVVAAVMLNVWQQPPAQALIMQRSTARRFHEAEPLPSEDRPRQICRTELSMRPIPLHQSLV